MTPQLKELLSQNGADLVGIGDMNDITNGEYRIGVSVAVALPKKIIYDLQEAPTKEYYELYHSLNEKLNNIVRKGEEYLREQGFDAYAQTTDRVVTNEERISKIPHKTVATRAGIGWIGKNCLLVTPQYGSAIRISSILTNAPLEIEKAQNKSLCGGCELCVKMCPAQALKGTLWEVGVQRKDIVDIEKCYKKQREIMAEKTGIEVDLCGKCFAVCAYTQKYLNGGA